MDVFEAVDSRISCRWFLDRPVAPELVRNLIAAAARAASGGNLQPWQVYALTGSALTELKQKVAAAIGDRDPRQVAAEYPIYPKTMWEPYGSRREHHGVQLYGALDIDRNDAAARLVQFKRNYEFFNAPVALFIAIDRRLGPGQWADLGGYIHALMYLARGHGLDTCAQESWARMHRIVGSFVKMPPEQMLFCAVSIGYGDRTHPANSFRAPRAPPEEFCRFFGVYVTERGTDVNRVVTFTFRHPEARAAKPRASKDDGRSGLPSRKRGGSLRGHLGMTGA